MTSRPILDGAAIWLQVTQMLGKDCATLTELLACLQLLGWSEGSIDGIIELIEASGEVETNDDLDFRQK